MDTYTDNDYTGEFNLRKSEKDLMCKALSRTNGKIEASANLMCISSRTFMRQMKKHQLYEFRDNMKSRKYNKAR